MKPVHTPRSRGAVRALAGAVLSACMVASIGLVSSSAAEPAAEPHEGMAAHPMHEAMAHRWEQHVQEHLDKLGERLEIKASQQGAWQKFSAAFRDTMRMHAMMGHAAMGETGAAAQPDAAGLARQQADNARERAQKLAQLADATAELQQALGADQRQVFNEAARHFAREHGGMGAMADSGHHGEMGGHCEWHGAHGDGHHESQLHSEYGDDGHASAMDAPSGADAAQGGSRH